MNEIVEVLSVPELSKKASVPTYTIRKLIADGRLPCLKMGNKFFVRVSDFNGLFRKEQNNDN